MSKIPDEDLAGMNEYVGHVEFEPSVLRALIAELQEHRRLAVEHRRMAEVIRGYTERHGRPPRDLTENLVNSILGAP